MENTNEKTRCLILGSGPAGLTAAIYASRAGLAPIVLEGIQPGGQLTMTTDVENFPGYPDGISGFDMMEDIKKQAIRFGADVRWSIATEADLSSFPFKITIDQEKIVEADTLIIATGAAAKYLGLPDEHKYAGSGVSACATCDGFFYRKKDVAVVGGGDTACEDALYLSAICNNVYLIVRRNVLRASQIMQKRIAETPNIQVLFEHETKSLFGEKVVEGAILTKKKGTPEETEVSIKIDGFFLAIGHTPNSRVFKNSLELDEVGYIKTIGGTPKTAIEGVYAAGDVADPIYRQAITSAGSGCKAAMEAERFLLEKGL